MIGTNIILGGCIIHTSKNLRAIRDYARVSPVVEIWSTPVGPGDKQGTFKVLYKNGATSRANFASYHIMIDWLRNRRTWRSAKHNMAGPDMGYLTKPGIIAGN